MFLVDANIFLYASNPDSPRYARCSRLVDSWREGSTPWYSTWSILYEFLRFATHPNAFQSPWSIEKALDYVRLLTETPSFTVLTLSPRQCAVLEETTREVRGLRGSVLHDVHTVVLMREHGISRIVTSDRDFTRFPFLDVIDPFRPGGGPMLVSDGPHPAYGTKRRSAPAIKRRPRRARGAR